MNVREALEASIREHDHDRVGRVLDDLAPIVEKALRASYNRGHTTGLAGHPVVFKEGVTAGAAAMNAGGVR